MKIYFIHENRTLKDIMVLISTFKTKTYKVIQKDLSKVNLGIDVDEILKFGKELSKQVSEVDAVIYECTKGDDHLPFIYKAAEVNNRPLFIIEEKGTKVEITKVHNANFDLFLCKYPKNQIESFSEQVLEQVKEIVNRKFILLMKPDMAHYLDWKKDHFRLPKAEIVRDAVISKMQKDKEYQKFLNEETI